MSRKIFLAILLMAETIIFFAGEKKALIYMMDGLRADLAENLNAPIWKALKGNTWSDSYRSAWSVDAGNDIFQPPNSAPNHASIVTGQYAKLHKVTNNKTFVQYDADAAPMFLQTLYTRKKISGVYAFSWADDCILIPKIPLIVLARDDVRNNLELDRILKTNPVPSVFLVFDDAPDHGAHASGFYPFGPKYISAARTSMERLERLLDTIKKRPQFKEEDWLIILCSDHGGFGKLHGMRGGHASTVPLLFCSKNIPAGYLSGRPENGMITPIVLRHFGLDDEARKLPGDQAIMIAAAPAKVPLSKDLRYDLVVKGDRIVNAAGNQKFTIHGHLPIVEDSFIFGKDSGFITLDALKNFQAETFTFALTLEPDSAAGKSEFPLFCNKDWKDGASDGFCFFVSGMNCKFNFARREMPATFLAPRPDQLDLFSFLLPPGKKNMLACSVGRNGLITLMQKHPDGYTYWFSVKSKGILCRSAFAWNLGQDGTGSCKNNAFGKISRFQFWDRALSLDELRQLLSSPTSNLKRFTKP